MRFLHPQESWDTKKCTRLAGKKGPYGQPRGVGHNPKHYAHGNVVDYNGGTIRDGVWYSGEEWPLPALAEGFEWHTLPSWGPQIRKIEGGN